MRTRTGLMVLGLAAMLGAAIAGAGCGDDGSGGSGGNGASGTTTTTMGPGGSGGSGAGGGSGGSGATGGGGSGGAAAGYCGRTCTTPADCCPMGLPNCPSNEYPTNFTCMNNLCGPPRCAVKDDCTANGMLPNNDCVQINGFPSCSTVCTTNAECSGTDTCTGMADDGTMLCQGVTPPPFMCDDDADCNGFGKCNAAGDGCYCDSSTDCMNDYLKDCIQ